MNLNTKTSKMSEIHSIFNTKIFICEFWYDNYENVYKKTCILQHHIQNFYRSGFFRMKLFEIERFLIRFFFWHQLTLVKC